MFKNGGIDSTDYYNDKLELMKIDVEHWREKYNESRNKVSEIYGKCEAYKQIIDKLLGLNKITDTVTDDVFIFKGEVYKPTSFTLSCEQDTEDTLTVEFIKCHPF